MKKFLVKLLAISLACCMLFTLTGCGEKEDGNDVGQFLGNSKKYTEFEDENFTGDEAISYLTNIKYTNQNPTAPNLEDGVRVYLLWDFTISGATISNFDMYLQNVNDTLIAQGSFTTSVGSATAKSKFYYDGTYLGIETTENNVVDRQKEEMPISSIGNLVGKSDLIEIIADTLNNPPISIDSMIEIIADNPESYYLSTRKYKDSNCLYAEYIDMVVVNNSQYEIALDTSFNVLAYRVSFEHTISNYLGIEITNQVITMPSDFDSWTIRPAA